MKISFIIPVYGQWQLTKNCLLSLKECVHIPFEVILINNGAKVLENDETDKEAYTFCTQLFASNFKYLAQEENINFAAACNLGAKKSSSPLLFFLNNDTIVMNGFLEPLLQELDKDNTRKILAPLLLYPKIEDNLHTIQHMGIVFLPNKKVVHLYENFPENHRVTRRPKELQAITAAAFLIKKEDFDKVQGFNEEFRNGFEDIELCSRFNKNNLQYQVVNSSKIIHYCSQSQGRSDFDVYNADLLQKLGTADKFKADWHTLLENDGYELHLTKWLSFVPYLSEKHNNSLKKIIDNNDLELLKKEYAKEPYWYDGLKAIINHQDCTLEDKWKYFEYGQKFNKDLCFEYLICIYENKDILSFILSQAEFQEDYPTVRLKKLKNLLVLLKPISSSLFLQCSTLINEHEEFINNEYKEIKNRLICC